MWKSISNSGNQFPNVEIHEYGPSDQCRSPECRTIIATDCPASCGFCNLGGCVDAVPNCATDLSICTAVGLHDFSNKNCQRTCARCPSSTSTSVLAGIAAPCRTFSADASPNCANWKRNGFCTNGFYALNLRKKMCGTTCQLC